MLVLLSGTSSGREAREKGEKERGTIAAPGGGKEGERGKNGWLLTEREGGGMTERRERENILSPLIQREEQIRRERQEARIQRKKEDKERKQKTATFEIPTRENVSIF